jgi:regulatory protein
MNFKRSSKEQALPKIKLYCAYQERCHLEVKEKLYSFGLYKKDVEQLMAQLIEENYLNEERFAIQYAGGKFRMNKWGKVKIKYALRQKHVSEYSIKKALKEISEIDYKKTLDKLVQQKLRTLKK